MNTNETRLSKKEKSRLRKEKERKKAKFQKIMNQVYIFLMICVPIAVLVIYNIVSDDSKDNNKKVKSTTTTTVAPTSTTTNPNINTSLKINDIKIDKSKNYGALVKTNFGNITINLDEQNAPINTARFVSVAKSKGYDGLTFHRIIKDFMIQGGDPNGNGSGGYGNEVVGELPSDGYKEGVVAWAKTSSAPAGSGDSQFFIMAKDNKLPSEYGYIGKVVKGMDVVAKINNLPTDASDAPTQKVVIESIEIFANGNKI